MDDQRCKTQIYRHPNNNKSMIILIIMLISVIIWALVIINHRSCKASIVY